MPTLDIIKDRLPDHAKDLKLNLGNVLDGGALSDIQRWSVALACAIAARNPDLLAAIEGEAAGRLDDAARRGARAAAAIMSMNNVYYRFLSLVSNPDYQALPARLRMQVIGNPGVPALDFELACLAVSAINACKTCVASHEAKLLKEGGSKEMVQDAVRIAAVIFAVAVTLGAVPLAA